jgi:hypothetical protein
MCIKPSAQIRRCDAKDNFELQNYHNQNIRLEYPVEIRKQIALEAAGEADTKPKVLNLTERFGPIKIFEAVNSKKQ